MLHDTYAILLPYRRDDPAQLVEIRRLRHENADDIDISAAELWALVGWTEAKRIIMALYNRGEDVNLLLGVGNLSLGEGTGLLDKSSSIVLTLRVNCVRDP